MLLRGAVELGPGAVAMDEIGEGGAPVLRLWQGWSGSGSEGALTLALVAERFLAPIKPIDEVPSRAGAFPFPPVELGLADLALDVDALEMMKSFKVGNPFCVG